jgi:ketosteroid isomerase-like protein
MDDLARNPLSIVSDSLQALADGGLDAMAEYWDDEINWRAIEGAPDDVGEMHGRERVRRYFQEWVDLFEGITNVAEELVDLGDDRVLALQRASGRAKLSGAETEMRFAVVYTLRDGKIASGREYMDRAQALDALSQEASRTGRAVSPPRGSGSSGER